MDADRKTPAQLLVQERTGRDLEELLRELYIERRHSQGEIADALTKVAGTLVARTTVKLWLGQFGITRDDRPAVAL